MQKIQVTSALTAERSLIIGRYGDKATGADSYPFNGNISTFVVIDCDEADKSLSVSDIVAK